MCSWTYWWYLLLTNIECKLLDYNLSATSEGMNAQGQVDVVVLYNGRKYYGRGLSTDVIESSALAFVHACNSIYRAQIIEKEKEQGQAPHGECFIGTDTVAQP